MLSRHVISKFVKEAGYFGFELTKIAKMSTQEELNYCYDFVLDLTIESGKVNMIPTQFIKNINLNR